jgi:hypothetical protein
VTFASAWLSAKTASITFAITGISATGYAYDPSANTDPDGDSNGSRITVNKNGTTVAVKQLSGVAETTTNQAAAAAAKKKAELAWDLALLSLTSTPPA